MHIVDEGEAVTVREGNVFTVIAFVVVLEHPELVPTKVYVVVVVATTVLFTVVCPPGDHT